MERLKIEKLGDDCLQRPMGADTEQNKQQMYEHQRLQGISEGNAIYFATVMAGMGKGIHPRALDKAREDWEARRTEQENRRKAVEERAQAAAERSPNTSRAIESRERRQKQKARGKRK